ncbi:MAG: radical SAM protein [Candidatus Azambacteria bacterium]|nr:radical SAM protein [Candidatus Azambacteria bacterium]
MTVKPLKIYLCDLVHNYSGVGSYTFPLNIGYIAAFAKKFLGENVEIELFKYPKDFMEKFKREKCDLVGFSNYTWNADLNNKISDWVKKIFPKTIVVFGGPNISYSEDGYKRFFSSYKSVDFYVLYQGEIAFLNVLKRIIAQGQDLDILKKEPIDGIVFYDREKDLPVCGNIIPRIKDLDSISSPYLTGILDKFFETNLIPIAETNRGCPYRCTYCCQGAASYNQIEFFDLERIKKELEYIANKVKNTNILLFADSNFGILERDIEIAKYIAQLMQDTGYPRRVSMNWAKNQPKIFEIAKILKNINLIISLQSLDEAVLNNIKRQNISTAVFQDIIKKVNQDGGISGTEIILALPGETKESHLESLRKLFDWNVSYIICYNCLVLEGSEMTLQREKGDLKCETKFRLIDNSFGKYGEILSFEAEEGIRELETMSEEEILSFRPVHWLIQFLWNYRFYYDLLKFLQSLGISPLDYIVKLIENAEGSDTPEQVKEIFRQFQTEAKKEWFDSPEAMHLYYSRPENFKWLEEGNYGKMNSKYIFKVILEAKNEFERYLYNTAINYSPVANSKKITINEILSFLSSAIIDFNKKWEEISKEKNIKFNYNVLGWRNSCYKAELDGFYQPEKVNLLYVLSEAQQKSLQILLKQYNHPNKNVTLRKMSEFMDIRDFFYQIKAK